MSNALAPRDAERLADLEVTIAQGLTTFVEVGAALAEIREKRLYREGFSSFELYCGAKWQMTPQHAGRLIGAAQVVGNLEPIGSIPASESVARLPRLPLRYSGKSGRKPSKPRRKVSPRLRTLRPRWSE